MKLHVYAQTLKAEAEQIKKENEGLLRAVQTGEERYADALGWHHVKKYAGETQLQALEQLAEVLVPLTPVILSQLKPGGVYITSGIIDDKEELVVETVKKCGLTVLEVTHQGEWVSVTARKEEMLKN